MWARACRLAPAGARARASARLRCASAGPGTSQSCCILIKRLGRTSVRQYLLHANQHPASCLGQKFLIVDDISTESGLGWSLLGTLSLLVRAVQENRILVHASRVVHNVSWSWCAEPSQSLSCFFNHWSPCEALPSKYIGELSVADFQRLPSWLDPERNTMRVTAFHNLHAASSASSYRHPEDAFYPFEEFFETSVSPLSKGVWYGALFDQMYHAQAWVQDEVSSFLKHHISDGEHFIVAHVRHGHKSTEAPVTPLSVFYREIDRLARCTGTKNVFVVTETQSCYDDLRVWGEKNGYNIFTVDYYRPSGDVWNPTFVEKYNLTKPDFHEIGWASILSLFVSQRSSGFVGHLHSAWAKLTLGAMCAHSCPLLFVNTAGNDPREYFLGNLFQEVAYTTLGERRCPAITHKRLGA